ncbi:MAG: ParA family protein, partial [Planctomycetota bacterium]|nr:ParA family protein [Planctomycetota bacterium]
MKRIAVINEKGGTAKTTTAVNLSAALAERGLRVLLVDLDGQAASSRWLGVEEDSRLADAIIAGEGLQPIVTHVKNLWLAPASGKLDSISHDLRPTQGGQLRRVLGPLDEQFDFCLMDCPPSLGNRLIGNALLAAQAAIVPVETSILALDGLRILLTVLEDVRKGFDHDIELLGVLPCRYDARTRLSRLVAAELERALPGRVFHTRIREAVRIRECPAVSQTIFEYAPDCTAAADYRALAGEILEGRPIPAGDHPAEGDLARESELSQDERRAVGDFRRHAAKWFAAGPADGAACETPAMAEETEAGLVPASQEDPGLVGGRVAVAAAPPASPPVVAVAPEPALSVPVMLAATPSLPAAPDAWGEPTRGIVRANSASAAVSLAKTLTIDAVAPTSFAPPPAPAPEAWVAAPIHRPAPTRRRWLAPVATTLALLTVVGVWLVLRALPPRPTPAEAAGGLVAAPTTPPLPPAPSPTPPVVGAPAPVAPPAAPVWKPPAVVTPVAAPKP